MFNAVRMDIYRLIHTKSAYVILVIAMALAIATSGMTALVRSMAADSIVETNEQVNMVSESDSEITGEYDTASAEASNGPTSTVGLEVDDSDMSDEVPTIADMVESDIAGLDLALLLAIFTVLFSTADLNSGYIKSVGGQVKSRGVLLFSKMIALSVFTFVAMALDVIVQCIATPLFLHGAEFGDAWQPVCGHTFVCIFCHGNGNHYKKQCNQHDYRCVHVYRYLYTHFQWNQYTY